MILSLDIGSVTIKAVVVDTNFQLVHSFFEFHAGDTQGALRRILTQIDLTQIHAVTSNAKQLGPQWHHHDAQVALIAAKKRLAPQAQELLVIGGEQFFRLRFDEQNNYRDSKLNDSCASGTGGFLDQQSRRLGLGTSAELARLALEAKGEIPQLATRCAVFAKTDLLHAQQEGHALANICQGLCLGLARSVTDTLYSGEKITTPILVVGGVSLNQAVLNHLQEILKTSIQVVPQGHLWQALGGAYLLMDTLGTEHPPLTLEQLITPTHQQMREYAFGPLDLQISEYPDFSSFHQYRYKPVIVHTLYDVEVDEYIDLKTQNHYELFMGIDIGSTSTKIVLFEKGKSPIVGLYTRTAGQPFVAIRALFETIDHIMQLHQCQFDILGTGTTGGGRKFIGKIIKSDLVVDEITAHARAAYHLDPNIDTIIEIGGQDAKFTSLQNGRITFAVMNHVCAAGTGSFIEEQAQKLNCSLGEYSARALGQPAPMASDCCTVFMERDINHYLAKGHSVEEVLATILHSVRENYLRKVVQNAKIGQHICFQGATAKNRALVAAFEQKLGRPILVSRYCHLTGALGMALLCQEEYLGRVPLQKPSFFKGIDLFRHEVPIENEVCQICHNHCKLRVLDLQGERVVYGHLCGREEEGTRRKSALTNVALLRQKIFHVPKKNSVARAIKIGLPAGIYLFEELPFWKFFFSELGFEVITSEGFTRAQKRGKELAGAEFCSPIASLYGHVDYLVDRVDYIFLPTYLEAKREKDEHNLRQYCYYAQYASAVVTSIPNIDVKAKCISPYLDKSAPGLQIKYQIYNALIEKMGENSGIGLLDVYNSYNAAETFINKAQQDWQNFYALDQDRFEITGDSNSNRQFQVVLLGRPYTVLSPLMNKKIPQILVNLGIKAYFQDMLDYRPEEVKPIEELLKVEHWHYASKILEAAYVVAKSETLYPILVTSFKCAPDSCTIEYFKRIMDAFDRPYLIIQLDEHDSSVGYETRIEAAARSFKNHFDNQLRQGLQKGRRILTPQERLPINPQLMRGPLNGKMLLVPMWDQVTTPLVVANLRAAGIDAQALNETTQTIQNALLLNTGQCLPLSCITQGVIEYVEQHKLDPAQVALWMFDSKMACNVGMYLPFIKSGLESYGRGMEKVLVYSGQLTFLDFSLKTAINNYYAFSFGGYLKKMACRTRPYELEKGATDHALNMARSIINDAMLGRLTKMEAVRMAVRLFEMVKVDRRVEKPKVAIFGDFYVRENEVLNQNLIDFIEANGGEAIVTPFTDFFKLVSKYYFKRWIKRKEYLEAMAGSSVFNTLRVVDRKYLREFERILGPIHEDVQVDISALLKKFHLKEEHHGETFDNIVKIFHLKQCHPDIALFVQAIPSYCCPSLLTQAMSQELERELQAPLISITYDGSLASKNEVLLPYLRYPRNQVATSSHSQPMVLQ